MKKLNMTNYMNYKFLKHNRFYITLSIMFFLSLCVLIYVNKLEVLPITILGFMATVFSFLTYRYAKEKFRLDLLDRRFEIYEKTLEFCSLALGGGFSDDKKLIIAAESSFRGIGWHKSCALFGEDISDLFKKLNRSFAYLQTHHSYTPRATKSEKNGQEITTTI